MKTLEEGKNKDDENSNDEETNFANEFNDNVIYIDKSQGKDWVLE